MRGEDTRELTVCHICVLPPSLPPSLAPSLAGEMLLRPR